MVEVLVRICGSGLLQWRRWPVGPRLVFDQMAAPVLEIMDVSLYERHYNTNGHLSLGPQNIQL
jgi:hypothetical protein